MKLAGVVCTRNCESYDYCYRACIESLLPVCDCVAVSDGESTDGTQDILRDWARRDPRVILNVYPWPNPKGKPEWYADWIQYARQHAPGDYIFHLDADEVLHDESYGELQTFKDRKTACCGGTEKPFSVVCERFNFWKDHRSLIPHGHCCGHRVIRMAPQNMFLASDGYDPRGTEVPQIAQQSNIKVMHYGFIRKPAQFFEKARALQGMYFDTYDPRLEAAEKLGKDWSTMPGVTGWENNLVPYSGSHPGVIKPWLRERGYDV